jgi:hypothetical protein
MPPMVATKNWAKNPGSWCSRIRQAPAFPISLTVLKGAQETTETHCRLSRHRTSRGSANSCGSSANISRIRGIHQRWGWSMGCCHHCDSKPLGCGVRRGRASRRLGSGVLMHGVGYFNLRVVRVCGRGSKNSDYQASHHSGE